MESKKLITATDTQYSGCLLQALNDQRLQGLYCDVTVIVEDRKFRAHKNILSACSSYFHQLFNVAGQVVELNFVRAEIFAEILNYIYSAKIVRVKSDTLEELIKSGKLLGVPFIAELGIPLAQVKSISADGQLKTDQVTQDGAKNAIGTLGKITEISEMSMVEEPYNLSASSDDNDSDDDVIFCSETFVPSKFPKEKKEPMSSPNPALNAQAPIENKVTPEVERPADQIVKTPAQTPAKPVTPAPIVPPPIPPVNTNTNLPTPYPPASSTTTTPQQASGPVAVPVQTFPNTSSVSAVSVVMSSVAVNNLPKLQTIGMIQPKTELILDGDCISSPPPSAVAVGQPTIASKTISFDGVQKKQVVTVVSPSSSSKPGEFKIKIADVVSGSSKDSSEPRRIVDGKKVITLDTASEIESLSTGCKVYANIGEDTYDIVIPIKDDPEEGFSNIDVDGIPDSKKIKLKHEDHYELVVDGKVYYICTVCKRSYVCLTSLRRHYNVHSWERKYPCRYCERVFALAEYRTKHEIHHTGERRYQCLTCGGSFINYQVVASHIRSVHSLDPAGDTKLYRLNPCKSLQIRQCALMGDNKINVPIIDGGIVYDNEPEKPSPNLGEDHSNHGPKPVNWDDIFLQQSNQNMFKPSTSEGSTEFEFVIPESY
ncbi:transcriptional regulator Kaiso [Gastrophryne carolinensis]